MLWLDFKSIYIYIKEQEFKKKTTPTTHTHKDLKICGSQKLTLAWQIQWGFGDKDKGAKLWRDFEMEAGIWPCNKEERGRHPHQVCDPAQEEWLGKVRGAEHPPLFYHSPDHKGLDGAISMQREMYQVYVGKSRWVMTVFELSPQSSCVCI